MKTVVLVTGRARSGKDTFISEATKAIPPKIIATTITSIGMVKKALEGILKNCEIRFDLHNLTQADRQCLSDFKVALDKHYGYTDAYLSTILRDMDRFGPDDQNVCLFYQVREPENIRAIKEHYLGDDQVRVVSVLLVRANYPEDQPLADVEKNYRPQDFDYVLTAASYEMIPHLAKGFVREIGY